MEKKRKVCLVVPSLKAGGMERVMSTFANFLAEKPFIETHIVLMGSSPVFYEISERIIVHRPNNNPENEMGFIKFVRLIGYMRNKINNIKPDTILSFGETYNSFVLFSLLGTKNNLYVSDRSKIDKDWGVVHNFLRKWLYRKSKGIIAQTEYAKLHLFNITDHKNIQVIPNPVETKRMEKDRENVILNVGRLIKSKKVDELINIFSDLKLKDWQLWIVGNGLEKKVLERQVNRLNLQSRVKFWGYQKDVKQFYERSKIFAFTSHSEGFPNAILEAMVAGLPVIAYDCRSGPSDLINDGENGFLIDLGDKIEFKKKMKTLLNYEELRKDYGENSIRLSKRYDIKVIGEEYLKFILPS